MCSTGELSVPKAMDKASAFGLSHFIFAWWMMSVLSCNWKKSKNNFGLCFVQPADLFLT